MNANCRNSTPPISEIVRKETASRNSAQKLRGPIGPSDDPCRPCSVAVVIVNPLRVCCCGEPIESQCHVSGPDHSKWQKSVCSFWSRHCLSALPTVTRSHRSSGCRSGHRTASCPFFLQIMQCGRVLLPPRPNDQVSSGRRAERQ